MELKDYRKKLLNNRLGKEYIVAYIHNLYDRVPRAYGADQVYSPDVSMEQIEKKRKRNLAIILDLATTTDTYKQIGMKYGLSQDRVRTIFQSWLNNIDYVKYMFYSLFPRED